MKINAQLQELIAEKVLANAIEKEPSGRISASRLGWPVQWQMLHYFKVQPKPIDEYTLRKFARGKDVEDRIVEWIKPEQYQVECSYRGVVGIADMVMEYPIEVKSVTNMAFKYKQKEGPSLGHRLQGEFYAKALGFTTFGVAYVASDDYRVLCFEEEVTSGVDEAIDAYTAQVATNTVPLFVPKEAWNAKAEYNPYSEWMKLDEQGIAEKLAALGVVVPTALPLTN